MATLQPPYSSSSIKRKRPSMIEIPVVRLHLRIPAEDVVLGDNGEDCCCEPGVSALSIKGKKKFVEDTHKIVSSSNRHPNTRKAADFVAERLHRNGLEMMGSCETQSVLDEAIKAGYLRTDQEDERQRIEEKGGCVEMHRGMRRVHGVLCISRSIGDSHLKRWITAKPEIRIIALTPDLEFLILASDGLCEQVSNQEVPEDENQMN